MSRALTYLAKARPDALGHYFAFLKACGTQLDPKTRNLISLISKVHAQTTPGLRQYLRRALREGCTAAEVLDALLMAFPMLGLTKIVWAIEVIIDMDLPDFQLPVLTADGEWHDVLDVTGFAVGATRRVSSDGRSLFVHRHADGWRVYDSRCPHQATDMPELALDGTTLTCPEHGWTFDITTGGCIAIGDAPLRQWPTKVSRGRLLACW